ncbi:MAG: hypothetical protein KC621_32550, partial [Myxococcales bacterium]|nr:hypothetical protein [Myxococcales bacterium]
MWWVLAASAQDLVVDGTSITLGGVQSYRSIEVLNGGRITVTAPSLVLQATDHILVDATSRIDGVGRGYAGSYLGVASGPGPGWGSSSGGGGGGGHLGAGGQGATAGCALTGGAGGPAYDLSTPALSLGAGSGAGGEDRWSLGVAGPDGGATIRLEA